MDGPEHARRVVGLLWTVWVIVGVSEGSGVARVEEEGVGAVDPCPYDVYRLWSEAVVTRPSVRVVVLQTSYGEIAGRTEDGTRAGRESVRHGDGNVVWLIVVVYGEVDGMYNIVLGEGELEEDSEGDDGGESEESDDSAPAREVMAKGGLGGLFGESEEL